MLRCCFIQELCITFVCGVLPGGALKDRLYASCTAAEVAYTKVVQFALDRCLLNSLYEMQCVYTYIGMYHMCFFLG